MSGQHEFMKWQQERAKELFSLSHRLLETAKELGEHQVTEIKASMEHAKSYAKQAATNDVAKLKALQEQFSEDAMARMKVYQKKIKGLLKTMEDEAADEVEKHLNKARSAMEDWLKTASKNLPAGSDKFTDIVRDVSDAGHKVLKEGRKMAKQAAEAAEHGFANLEKMAHDAGKKLTPPASKKPAAKKVVRKPARKSETS
jgi:hypothetical protein